MNECGSNQNTSTEMLASEKDLGRHLEPLDSLGGDREASAQTRNRQNSNYPTLLASKELGRDEIRGN